MTPGTPLCTTPYAVGVKGKAGLEAAGFEEGYWEGVRARSCAREFHLNPQPNPTPQICVWVYSEGVFGVSGLCNSILLLKMES